MAVKTLIQVRRGSTSDWAAGSIVLSAGEWGLDTTTGRYKIGDGTTVWNSLTYAATLPTDFTGASGIGLSKGTNGSTITISVTGIPSSRITDFNTAVDARVTAGSVSSDTVMDIVGSGLIEGSNIDLTYSGHQLTIAVSGIGTNIQAYDAGLASIAGLTTGSGNYLFATASDVYTTGVITAFGRSLVDDVDASAGRTTLGVVIGTDVQAYDAQLADIAGLSTTDNGVIIGNGSNFVLETGDTLRTSIGLAIGSNVQAYDAGLQSIAGLTTGSGNYIYATASDVYTTGVITAFGRSLVDDADASAGRTTLGVVIGTDVQAYDAQLADVAGLSPTDNGVIIGNGSNFVVESAATLKTSLGLTIGTDVQAYDAELAAIAGLTSAADKGIQFTGTGTAAVFDLTTAGKALLDDADASAQRTTLGLAIGTNVQAYDAQLADVAGLSPTDNGVIIGNGTNFVVESAATLKTSLGLTIGTDVQAYDADLAAIAGLTSAANKGIQFTGTGTAAVFDLTTAGKALLDDADASAQRTTLGLVIGTDVAPIASPTFTGTVNASGLILSGDLTVNGTTTTVNSNTVNIGDSIIVLNSDETYSATQDAGIEVERGTDANVTLIWDEGNNRWTVGSETFVAATFVGALTGNADTVTTNANLTGDVTSVGNATSIASAVIVNADINSSAAIAFSKLASLTSANILVGNVSNVATSVGVTGDVTITNAGVTAIGSGKVTSTMILDGTILNADVNSSAGITVGKIALASNALMVGASSVGSELATGSHGYVLQSVSGVATWGTIDGGSP